MIYLTKFETLSEYDTKKASLLPPNVSYIELDEVIKYLGEQPKNPNTLILYKTTNGESLDIKNNIQTFSPNYNGPSILNEYLDSKTGYYVLEFSDEVKFIGDTSSESKYGVNFNGVKNTQFRNLKNIILPESLEVIGDDSFSYSESLESLTIPENVKTIGYEAFFRCISITELVLPDGITSIGSRALSFLNNVNTIRVPRGVTELPKNFMEYHIPNDVYIPTSVTKLNNYCFTTYNGNWNLHYEGSSEQWGRGVRKDSDWKTYAPNVKMYYNSI